MVPRFLQTLRGPAWPLYLAVWLNGALGDSGLAGGVPSALAALHLNGTAAALGTLDEARLRRLGCEDSPPWAALRRLATAVVGAGAPVGRHAELVDLAERLLGPYDQDEREAFQARLAEFLAQLTGKAGAPAPAPAPGAFCFPGYLTACFVRVARAAAAEAEPGAPASWAEVREANAQYCASLFGREASLDFLGSLGWPVGALDFEAHMRACPDRAFASRLAAALPAGVETYAQLRPHLPRPGAAAALRPGSVDPQGVAAASGIAAGRPRGHLRLASVDGGHCALWLEPAWTLRALFPGRVSAALVSFKDNRDCLRQLGPEVFEGQELSLSHDYLHGSPLLRGADILACQWVGECAKLRAAYSKPVIAYVGFLLLNDPSVGQYHHWSEPLPHYWERLEQLLACDVHGGGQGRGGAVGRPPPDGGPPCALVWEEPQLAEAAHWQMGARLPSVRPLALYVGARYAGAAAGAEVLVVNRGRLARDVLFTEAANALRGPRHPHAFVDQRPGMPYAAMARYRSAVLLPWDLNLVMLHDLYALELPLHLPDRAGLHHTAFAYFARFREASEASGQPWAEARPGRPASAVAAHPYSPFALDRLEPRDYWLGFTEYLRVPHVMRFSGLPELLLQALRLDGPAVAARMRGHNLRCRREARAFWGAVLAALERGAAAPRRGPAALLRFTTPYGRDLCWRGGLSRAACCGSPPHGAGPDALCFDDFWTQQRCCTERLRLGGLEDAACRAAAGPDLRAARGAAGGPWESPLDGRPFVHQAPSAREPFVFLWDEKCGGTTFVTWLKYSVWRLGKLRSSFIFTTPGHPVAVGSAFFLKTFSPERRRELEVVAGQLDWRALHEGVDCRARARTRCLLLVRHPVERFVSYYLERSDRRFEREVAGNRSIESWTAAELRRYLAAVSRRGLRFTGRETGLFCNGENLLCLDRQRTRPAALPLLRRILPAARERLYFRYLGGPQDRLAWLLDPERGDPRLGVWRLRQCVVSLQAEDYEGHRRVLGWHFPWIHELRRPGGGGAPGGEPVAARLSERSRAVRGRLPRFAREMIARFNARDMVIYRAARRQFRRQLRRIEEASGEGARWPPVARSTEEEVQDLVASELQDTATYRVHDGLNRYMLGL